MSDAEEPRPPTEKRRYVGDHEAGWENEEDLDESVSPWERKFFKLIATVVVLGSLTALIVWQARNKPDLQWEDVARLPGPEQSAFYLSSEAPDGDEACIEPFLCRGKTDYTLDEIARRLRADRTFRNVRREQGQVQAVSVSTPFKLADNFVFQAREQPARIEIYASPRLSVSDFGRNRERLEALREELRQAGILK